MVIHRQVESVDFWVHLLCQHQNLQRSKVQSLVLKNSQDVVDNVRGPDFIVCRKGKRWLTGLDQLRNGIGIGVLSYLVLHVKISYRIPPLTLWPVIVITEGVGDEFHRVLGFVLLQLTRKKKRSGSVMTSLQ